MRGIDTALCGPSGARKERRADVRIGARHRGGCIPLPRPTLRSALCDPDIGIIPPLGHCYGGWNENRSTGFLPHPPRAFT
eukprot:1746137-Rhodomonas_salina.2